LDQVKGKNAVGMVADEDKAAFTEMVKAVFGGERRHLVFDMIGLRGRRLTLETTSALVEDPMWPGDGKVCLGVTRDITERKLAEERLKRANMGLIKALGEVKTLSGLLPICASCKKIRDDKGYWNQLEAYIVHHTEATFTHGICPECSKKFLEEAEGL